MAGKIQRVPPQNFIWRERLASRSYTRARSIKPRLLYSHEGHDVIEV